jgi:hypothetical protein
MMMAQEEQLPDLIGDIYDAALDPSLWSEVVGKAARFVGGSAAAIFSKSPSPGVAMSTTSSAPILTIDSSISKSM